MMLKKRADTYCRFFTKWTGSK